VGLAQSVIIQAHQMPCMVILECDITFYFFAVLGPTPCATPPALLVLGIFEIGLTNYLPRLASNCDPPDLCLLDS
jgi:hypothetical protein